MRAISILAWPVLLVSLSGGTAGAEPRRVVVRGEASILAGDVAGARDQALTDARTRALEEAAGVLIDSDAVSLSDLFATSSVRIRARGALLSEKVLSEGADADGMFHVTLEASVSENRLSDELVRLVEADRVVVAARATGVPIEARDARLRGILATALREQGFQRVVEAEGVSLSRVEPARRLGLRRFADAVLVAEVELAPAASEGGGLWSVRASGRARLFRAATGETVATVTVGEARGFGPDGSRAAGSALDEVGKELGAKLASKILPEELRVVRVEVDDIPDFAGFERTRNLLAALRWVQDVRTDPVGYHARRTVFLMRTRLDPSAVGAALSRDPTLEVTSAGEPSVSARFRH